MTKSAADAAGTDTMQAASSASTKPSTALRTRVIRASLVALRRGLPGQPAVVPRRPRVWHVRIGAGGIARLLAYPSAVAQGRLVDRVGATVAVLVGVLARPHGQDHARLVAGADDHVRRTGRAVHEVPSTQPPLLPLDDQQRLTREHEEVLLVGLPVVQPDRLARPEHQDGDA